MKKIILQIAVTALLITNISCSNERETIIIEDTSETSSNIITKLPENAVNADDFLRVQGFDVKKSKVKTNLGSETLNKGTLSLGEGTGTFIKFFIVYPPDWSNLRRLNYLAEARSKTIREIFVITNSCDFIDTWYIEVLASDPIEKNRGKNVIVASEANADPDVSTTESDEGPGADGQSTDISFTFGEDYYHSCEEIILPPFYNLVLVPDGGGDSDNNSGSGTISGPNTDPTIPQE
ncbi:hypothetical protein EV195_1169 [Tenacibaculum skagerrakense]|uniref:Uncharacterized protein n=1 Tax=Tenacibaculum skagerrakense TaxID=186571 RepID=A0A4R2NJP0_9FLAO|nr:hypothetical protein [Tenacibaculum skagerrakense]TCP21743.1 hypothetical protein EV195_1169 [Tenacibaculum skagerrakense]